MVGAMNESRWLLGFLLLAAVVACGSDFKDLDPSFQELAAAAGKKEIPWEDTLGPEIQEFMHDPEFLAWGRSTSVVELPLTGESIGSDMLQLKGDEKADLWLGTISGWGKERRALWGTRLEEGDYGSRYAMLRLIWNSCPPADPVWATYSRLLVDQVSYGIGSDAHFAVSLLLEMMDSSVAWPDEVLAPIRNMQDGWVATALLADLDWYSRTGWFDAPRLAFYQPREILEYWHRTFSSLSTEQFENEAFIELLARGDEACIEMGLGDPELFWAVYKNSVLKLFELAPSS